MRYVVAALVLLAAVATFFTACRKDIVVEPPPSLSGDYIGTYSLKIGDQTETIRPIKWKFTAESFLMDVDTAQLATGQDRYFCDCGGIYSQTDRVEIRWRNESDKRRKVQTCFPDRGPYGLFSLDQSKTGVVVLQSQTTEDGIEMYRKIELNVVQ